MEYEYTDLCKAFSYSPERVQNLKDRMELEGFLEEFPIVLWSEEGGPLKILDGRHRYEAATEAGVAMVTKIFEGTRAEAEGCIKGFTIKNPNATSRDLSGNDKFNLFYVCGDYNKPVKEMAEEYKVSEPTIKWWRKTVSMDLFKELMASGDLLPHEARAMVKPQGDKSKQATQTVPETPYVSQVNAVDHCTTIIDMVWDMYNTLDDDDVVRGLAASLNGDHANVNRERFLKFVEVANELIAAENFHATEQPKLQLV